MFILDTIESCKNPEDHFEKFLDRLFAIAKGSGCAIGCAGNDDNSKILIESKGQTTLSKTKRVAQHVLTLIAESYHQRGFGLDSEGTFKLV